MADEKGSLSQDVNRRFDVEGDDAPVQEMLPSVLPRAERQLNGLEAEVSGLFRIVLKDEFSPYFVLPDPIPEKITLYDRVDRIEQLTDGLKQSLTLLCQRGEAVPLWEFGNRLDQVYEAMEEIQEDFVKYCCGAEAMALKGSKYLPKTAGAYLFRQIRDQAMFLVQGEVEIEHNPEKFKKTAQVMLSELSPEERKSLQRRVALEARQGHIEWMAAYENIPAFEVFAKPKIKEILQSLKAQYELLQEYENGDPSIKEPK